MKSVSIRVTGRVQGVFYRASAREMAVQHGLKGLVRNEPDGSVYIEAEGDPEAVNRFVAWCRKGPPWAVVQDVLVQEQPLRNFNTFQIDR